MNSWTPDAPTRDRRWCASGRPSESMNFPMTRWLLLLISRIRHRFAAAGRRLLPAPGILLAAAILLSALPLLTGCSSSTKAGRSQAADRVLLVVNGEPIGNEMFETFVRFNRSQQDQDPVQPSRQELFEDFVLEQIVLQQAERSGTKVSEQEIKELVAQWLPNEAEDSLSRKYVRNYLKVQKFIGSRVKSGVHISVQEMQKYYEDHEDQFIVNDHAHVLEILVPDRQEAEDIRSQLEPGNVRKFKEVATRRSQGLTASSGGDLGLFERGELPEEFEKLIFALKPGEISSIFHSDNGYHIFMMEEWIPRHAQKFHEVQKAIFQKLAAAQERRALNEYLKQLVQNASITVYDKDLRFERRDYDAN